MDRVGSTDALLIVRVTALRGKFLMLRPVEISKGASYHVAVRKLRRISQWLEEPPPHDLEPLFGARRSPRRFDPPHDIAQTFQRFASALAAYLHIFPMSMG